MAKKYTPLLSDNRKVTIRTRKRAHASPERIAYVPRRAGKSVSLTSNDVITLADQLLTDEQRSDYADRVKRAAYFSAVRGIADDVKSAIKAKEITNRESLIEYIEQSCDGSYWTTYTHANFEVLRWSDNQDAYTEDFGEAPIENGDVQWSALAYMALRADVIELLDALGVDVNTFGESDDEN